MKTQNRLHILLVEDEPGDALLVEMPLLAQRPPCRLTRAASLAEALAANREDDAFDVILLDLSLPDSSGFSTVASIRNAYPASPIIVLTGLDDPAVENKTVSSGAQDYLLKGNFDDRGLLRAIRHAIVRHRLEQRLVTSEAEHRSVVNLAPEAIVVVAPDRTIISVNPAAARIFGTDRGEALSGLPLAGILPDAGKLIDMNSGLSEIRGEGIGLRDGSSFLVALAVAPLGGGRWLVMASDITDRVRLTNELLELARTDPLTGLANRRTLIEAIDAEFHRGKRFAVATAVLMIDVDHFKQVNDLRGHEAGDRALVALAAILKTMARTTDLPARFGGEEFVLLLIGTDLSGAAEMAERIRNAAAQIRVASPSGDFGFTVSIGVTTFAYEDDDWSEAVRRADQGLYQAKESGRNRVVTIAPKIDAINA